MGLSGAAGSWRFRDGPLRHCVTGPATAAAWLPAGWLRVTGYRLVWAQAPVFLSRPPVACACRGAAGQIGLRCCGGERAGQGFAGRVMMALFPSVSSERITVDGSCTAAQ